MCEPPGFLLSNEAGGDNDAPLAATSAYVDADEEEAPRCEVDPWETGHVDIVRKPEIEDEDADDDKVDLELEEDGVDKKDNDFVLDERRCPHLLAASVAPSVAV